MNQLEAPNGRDNTRKAAESTAARPTDEIDVLAYLNLWWRYRYVLLAAVLATGAVTYAINRQLAPTYEVEFRLMASEPRLGNEPAREQSVVEFRELVESQTLAAGLVDEFNLGAPPYNLTPRSFLDDHVSVEIIRDSSIIRVAVRLQDRDLLVKVARRYAERVVEVAQKLNTEGLDYTTERIRQQRDAALERLTAAERAVQELRGEAQIEVLRRDVDTMLERRPDALDLNVRIQGERARVQQAEAELAKQDRVRTVRRSVDALPEARQEPGPIARRAPGASSPEAVPSATAPPTSSAPAPSPNDPRGSTPAREQPREPDPSSSTLEIRSELLDPYVNPVYEALQRDLSDSRARLASLEQQRKELVSRLQLDAPNAERLTRLYQAEAALDAVTRDRDVAREAYLSAATKYEDARLQSTLRSPRLHILDVALPPDRPVAPRALRNSLTAMLLAFTLAAAAVVAWDARRRS